MVIISNGFNKFHLTCAASELNKIGLLSLLITGAYPKSGWLKDGRLPVFRNNSKINRLLARKDDVDDKRVRSLWLPEAIHAGAMLSSRYPSLYKIKQLEISAFEFYGFLASKIIRSSGKKARIYHYRAGFGGDSVEAAKSYGMFTLCDHSSAHPALLSYLVNNGGSLPKLGQVCNTNRFESWLLADIQKADAVLVNSEFAKETFINQSWPSNRIHTIYWGVDDQFIHYKKTFSNGRKEQMVPLRLLFAGSFELRKGAAILIEALQTNFSSAWNLEIIGPIHPEIGKRYSNFFKDPRVKCNGTLQRSEVAKRMQAADIFLFPSLSEGSARVIFEALACGCYIITTPNSGSIVKQGVHGALISPNDPSGIARAIQWAVENRKKVLKIGQSNANLISRHYSQSHYGSQLVKLYNQLLLSTGKR